MKIALVIGLGLLAAGLIVFVVVATRRPRGGFRCPSGYVLDGSICKDPESGIPIPPIYSEGGSMGGGRTQVG